MPLSTMCRQLRSPGASISQSPPALPVLEQAFQQILRGIDGALHAAFASQSATCARFASGTRPNASGNRFACSEAWSVSRRRDTSRAARRRIFLKHRAHFRLARGELRRLGVAAKRSAQFRHERQGAKMKGVHHGVEFREHVAVPLAYRPVHDVFL